jgi:hypothetical protein
MSATQDPSSRIVYRHLLTIFSPQLNSTARSPGGGGVSGADPSGYGIADTILMTGRREVAE